MGRGRRARQGASGFLRRALLLNARATADDGSKLTVSFPAGSTLPLRCSGVLIHRRCFCRQSVRFSVVAPSTMSWMGVARRLLNMRSILHLHGLRHLRTRNPCPRRPLHPRAPARRSQQAAPVTASTSSAPEPAAPKPAAPITRAQVRCSRLRPSHPTWPRPLGCAPTTLPVLLPRASSRPSPRPERPSARPLPRLSRLRRLRHGNPSRCPTTTPWSAVLLPMPAGTICPRSTCRVRRPRPSPAAVSRGSRSRDVRSRKRRRPRCPLGVQPRRRQSLRPPGRSPEHSADRGRGQSPHPQRLWPGHHLQTSGVTVRAGTLLKKRSLCPGASVFRTCVVWCRVYRIRADRHVTVGLGC